MSLDACYISLSIIACSLCDKKFPTFHKDTLPAFLFAIVITCGEYITPMVSGKEEMRLGNLMSSSDSDTREFMDTGLHLILTMINIYQLCSVVMFGVSFIYRTCDLLDIPFLTPLQSKNVGGDEKKNEQEKKLKDESRENTSEEKDSDLKESLKGVPTPSSNGPEKKKQKKNNAKAKPDTKKVA